MLAHALWLIMVEDAAAVFNGRPATVEIKARNRLTQQVLRSHRSSGLLSSRAILKKQRVRGITMGCRRVNEAGVALRPGLWRPGFALVVETEICRRLEQGHAQACLISGPAPTRLTQNP